MMGDMTFAAEHQMHLFPIVVGASAVMIGGCTLFVAFRRGDNAFRNTQAIARKLGYVVLPLWAMKALFYPSMIGFVIWGVFILATGLGFLTGLGENKGDAAH